MYRIAVLVDTKERGSQLAGWVEKVGREYGMFPLVFTYEEPERFFNMAQEMEPDGAVIDLPGVAGLNAAEHLRSLCPGCGLFWCSDLDFSLQAYRLRAEYFLLGPACEEEFKKGFSLWFEGHGRKTVGNPAGAVAIN